MTDKTTAALKLAEVAANRAITTLEYLKNIGVHSDSIDPTIRAEKKALAAIREALADHSGDANEMVAEPVKPSQQADASLEPVAEAHSGNLRWLIPDEEQPANAKLFLHPSESRFNATYENGAPMYSKTIVKENGDPIMLNKDGARSIFCDVDDGCEAAPVDAKAIRAEALEEAAKVCEDWLVGYNEEYDRGILDVAAAIRSMK